MKSITIHNLDDQIDFLIREKAKMKGLSLNKTIKILLKESLGLKPKDDINNNNDFIDLFGSWSEEDEKEFTENIKDLNKVNNEDWE